MGDDPRDRILRFVRLLIVNRARIMAFGCPVGTLCAELAKLDHDAQPRAAGILLMFRDWLTDQFRALGAGDAAGDLALHLLGWTRGTAVLATALRDEAMIRREVATAESWLAGLPYPSPSA